MEAIGNLDKHNLICVVVIEALSDWVKESVGGVEAQPGL